MLSVIVFLALQQSGPALPVGVAPHLADLSLQIQRELESGNFPAAEKLMGDWPAGTLGYSATGLPTQFSDAGDQAAKLVGQALTGRIKFEPASNPKVLFTFVDMPPEGPAEPLWKDGKVHLAIPIRNRDGEPANTRSIIWSMAKGMAYAAGLDITTKRRSLMAPVIYAKSVADPSFSDKEKSILVRIEEVRNKLESLVRAKTRVTPAEPTVKASPGLVDLGTVVQGDKKEFEITLTNTGNAPAEIEIETTCACLIAQPSLTLAPGESVTQHPRFDSSDYQGPLEKHMFVLSNSPKNPRYTIVMKGNIVPEVRFLAPKGARAVHEATGMASLNEVEAAERGPSTFELYFYGTGEALELVDVQLGNKLASVSAVPFTGHVDDPVLGPSNRTGTKAVVEIPESWPFGVSWLRIVGVTTSKRRPSVEMTLQIRKGITVSPQTLYFGDVKVGTPSERSAVVDHLSKPFKISKVTVSDGYSVRLEELQNSGKRYKVTVTAMPKAAGPMSGTVELTTDSPAQPLIRIPIGGQAG